MSQLQFPCPQLVSGCATTIICTTEYYSLVRVNTIHSSKERTNELCKAINELYISCTK